MVKIEFDNTGRWFCRDKDTAQILVQLSGIVAHIPGRHERHVCDGNGNIVGKMTVDELPPE